MKPNHLLQICHSINAVSIFGKDTVQAYLHIQLAFLLQQLKKCDFRACIRTNIKIPHQIKYSLAILLVLKLTIPVVALIH